MRAIHQLMKQKMMSIKLEIRVQTCGFVCFFVCYFHANFLSLNFSFNVKVTICCLMWFGSHAGRSSKRHNEIIWLRFFFPVSLLWANVHSCFSPAAMTTPAFLSFFSFCCPACRIVGPEGLSFPFFFFLRSERHVSRGHRPLGNQCGGCCRGRPASLSVFDACRVGGCRTITGCVWTLRGCVVLCVCEFSPWVYTTIVGLGGSEFWPAHFPGAHSRR